MGKKEVKTNAVRILERNKIEYELINYECDENGTYKIKDNAEFYKVDNRVRKVWEVKIYYDYYNEYYQERYVYYVDATTGEIIGGNRWNGSNEQVAQLMEDQYNLIEK